MLPKSLDPETLRTVALGGSIASIVVAIVVLRFVRKLLLKIVLVGALAGAGMYAWSQRAQLEDCVPHCACTFIGVDVRVDAPGCTTGPDPAPTY